MREVLEFEQMVIGIALVPIEPAWTRWLTHATAVDILHKTLPGVIAGVMHDAHDKDPTAIGLLASLSDFDFIACLCLMRDVLPVLAELSRSLQTRNQNFVTAEV